MTLHCRIAILGRFAYCVCALLCRLVLGYERLYSQAQLKSAIRKVWFHSVQILITGSSLKIPQQTAEL